MTACVPYCSFLLLFTLYDAVYPQLNCPFSPMSCKLKIERSMCGCFLDTRHKTCWFQNVACHHICNSAVRWIFCKNCKQLTTIEKGNVFILVCLEEKLDHFSGLHGYVFRHEVCICLLSWQVPNKVRFCFVSRASRDRRAHDLEW